MTGTIGLQSLQLSGLNWAALQQAVSASKTAGQQTPTTIDSGCFVPGAISNRTLEHLTETMSRAPVRAIRGSDFKLSPTQ